MVICVVKKCKSRSCRDVGIRFFQIPKVVGNRCAEAVRKTERRRALWLSTINKPDLNDENVKDYTKVCSRHFVSGAPAHLCSEVDPDWAPSLHMGHEQKEENLISIEDHELCPKRAKTDSNEEEGSEELAGCSEVNQSGGNIIKIEDMDVKEFSVNLVSSDSVLSKVSEAHGSSAVENIVCNPEVNSLYSYESVKGTLDDVEKKYVNLRKDFIRLRNHCTEVECDKLDLENVISAGKHAFRLCDEERNRLEDENTLLKSELNTSRLRVADLEQNLAECEAESSHLLKSVKLFSSHALMS